MKVGIIAAMPEEAKILKHRLENVSEETSAGIDLYLGKLHGKEIALCCCGMGKVSAGAAAQLLISKYGCEMIINTGIAGNMTSAVGIGDIVISKTAVYHDADNSLLAKSYPNKQAFEGDKKLINAAERACEGLGIKYITGTIATGDRFIGSTEEKQRIALEFAPHCVEMEGAAIAHVASKNGVPFVIIRSMSDDSDEEATLKLIVKKFDITEYCVTASNITDQTLFNL